MLILQGQLLVENDMGIKLTAATMMVSSGDLQILEKRVIIQHKYTDRGEKTGNLSKVCSD